MKPLLLELQAFGPFARRQSIDFGELGSKTFFLIHGPTGAGKTSLLDGICFALFGDSSGGERDGRQMRSHHADNDTLTEVRYGFALGASRYRVRRVPEQMRKARRGDGETKQLQIAELCRIDTIDGAEVEHPLASGWGKVTEAVVKLLGFESAQFRQVIVLPQGKFFEFLKSSSQEREKILQTLFGTELYKRIEEQLKLAARDLADRADSVRTQRQTLLDQARAIDLPALEARLQQQALALAERRSEEQTSAAAAKAAELALMDARRVADRFDEFDKAAAALQSLHAQEAGWSLKRGQLADARRAAAIAPYAAAVVELDKRLADAARQGELLSAQCQAAVTAHAEAEAALQRERQRAPEAEHAITRIAQLDALAERVAALALARAGHAAASATARKAGAGQEAARRAHKAAAEALQNQLTRSQALRVAAAGMDGLRAVRAQAVARLEQASKLDQRLAEQARATKRVADDQARLQSAARQCQMLAQQRDRLRRDWVDGQAARLAQELVADQPCPVCGGRDHPAPAQHLGELVLDQTLSSAEDALAQAETAQREAVQAVAASQQAAGVLAALISELRLALGDASASTASPASPASPTSLTALRTQADAAQAALTEAEAAARSLSALDAGLPAAQRAASEAEAAAASADAAAQLAQSGLQQMNGQLAEREAGVPAELAEPDALAAARLAAVALRDTLQRSLDAATALAVRHGNQLAEAKTRLEASVAAAKALSAQRIERAADLDQRLSAAHFADIDAFARAHLDAQAMSTLEQGLAGFDAALAAATARQSRAAEATAGLARPDLPALTTQHESAKAAQLAASNAVRDALAAQRATAEIVESLARLADEYQAIEGRYQVLKQIADVAGGINPQRMSFQRYVLATLLEEVLAATTLRLRVMSRGRYAMQRKLAAADQRSAAGLDLEVFDQYTGTTRAVSTLSGGESFLASLALALGLSDVVQSYAGGIRLDAIFVDEGFGTLDPESLDFAVRALQDLQQAGRMVGIISHVAELKEWIDARLELSATQTGSVAHFVV